MKAWTSAAALLYSGGNMEELSDFAFDAVIVGAGPAGCAVAAALSSLGKNTLLVDAGVDRKKLFSGELIHPAGVSGLAELGFADALSDAGAVIVKGFAVLEPGRAPMLLAYDTLGTGVTLEHAALLEAMHTRVAELAGVTSWAPARVDKLIANDADGVVVQVNRGGDRVRVRARSLIMATGRAQALRDEIGIKDHHEKVSMMLGLTVDSSLLPYAEQGHVFADGYAPILAYAIAPGVARVLVDVPSDMDWRALLDDAAWPLAVPEPLHSGIREAMAKQKPAFASNDVRLPDAVVRGRVVLVGDAAGCCHPLSVSGITSSIRDALALRDAMRASPDDAPAALRAYSRARRAPQRTRIALASALYRAFAEPSGEMELLRRGMRRYWGASVQNQQASLALLAGRDVRMTAMAKEYGSVVGHALMDWTKSAYRGERPDGAWRRGWVAARGALARNRSACRNARDALVGALDDTALVIKQQAGRLPVTLPLAAAN